MKLFANSFRVAIVGGGPGGLALARILQQRVLKAGKDPRAIIVYESELSSNARGQGGTLDLHAESGQSALKAAGLYDQFLRLCRPEGQDFKLFDKYGHCHLEEVSPEGNIGRPEIDRFQLRDMLLSSLVPGTVKWGHKLHGLRELSDKPEMQLAFADGRSANADLVVGADGAWSKVRAFLAPDARPQYTGISFIDFHVNNPDAMLSDFVGRGTMSAAEPGKGLIAQQTSSGMRIYAAMQCAEDWLDGCAVDFADARAARQFLRAQYDGWDPRFHALFLAAGAGEFVPRRIHALPAGFAWPHARGRATLVGDAAHVMSPFAGEGVNLALADAAALADALCDADPGSGGDSGGGGGGSGGDSGGGGGGGGAGRALADYQAQCVARARPAAEESARNLGIFFGPGAPGPFAALMRQVMAGGPPAPAP